MPKNPECCLALVEQSDIRKIGRSLDGKRWRCWDLNGELLGEGSSLLAAICNAIGEDKEEIVKLCRAGQ